jgi:hypothetical protein
MRFQQGRDDLLGKAGDGETRARSALRKGVQSIEEVSSDVASGNAESWFPDFASRIV